MLHKGPRWSEMHTIIYNDTTADQIHLGNAVQFKQKTPYITILTKSKQSAVFDNETMAQVTWMMFELPARCHIYSEISVCWLHFTYNYILSGGGGVGHRRNNLRPLLITATFPPNMPKYLAYISLISNLGVDSPAFYNYMIIFTPSLYSFCRGCQARDQYWFS